MNRLRLFLFGWTLCLPLLCWSQTLTQVRVFFNDNASLAQYFDVPSLASLDLPYTVNVGGLQRGIHTMYVEVRDNFGRWSLYDCDNIQVWGGLQMATLNACEYFFNTDPGWGEGIQIPLSSTPIDQSIDLNLSGLPNGVHVAYLRVRDGANQWSLYAERVFQIVGSMQEELVEAEYFFNVDPGLGNGMPLQLSQLAFAGNLELSVEGLANGVHTLYLRVKDARGVWSHYDQHNVVITGPNSGTILVEAEYFFDDDPGLGNGIALLIPQSSVVDGEFPITLPAELTGTHSICIRVKDINEQWSETVCRTLTICNAQPPQISTNGQYCQSSPLVLTAAAGYDSYNWSNGLTGSSISITEPGTYTVNVNDNGCAASASIDTEFEYIPAAVFTQTGSNCAGVIQTLSVIDVYDNLVWQDGQTSSSITVSESGVYEVTVSNGTCSSDYSTSVQFYTPIAPIITTSGSSCEGELLTLGLQGNYTGVVWSNGTMGSTTTVSQNGTYTLQAFDQGCLTDASINVTFDTAPQFEISQSGGPCEGDEVTLNVPSGFDSYQWSEGSQTESQSVFTSGDYNVTVFNGSCATQQSILIQLTQPIIPIITQNGNVLACNINGAQYQWFFNGVEVTGATAQFYSATAGGFYAVEATLNGCSVASAVFNLNYIGIEKVDDSTFHVYPNPTSDVVICRGNFICKLDLFDMTGRFLRQIHVNGIQALIDLTELANGQYMLVVTDLDGIKTSIRVGKQ